jgi:predicted amidohydrolase YtcJ
MCLVCGGWEIRSIASPTARVFLSRRAQAQFVAEEIAPPVVPPLDPNAREVLDGPADVILHGGPILTMIPGAEHAQAVAVRAGRIQRVGDLEATLACRGRPTRIFNLEGRALLPGFVNAHWHPPLDLVCDFIEAESTSELSAAIVANLALAKANGATRWLVVHLNETAGADSSAIDDTLDEAAPSRPAIAVDTKRTVVGANRLAATLTREFLHAGGHCRLPDAPSLQVSTLMPLFLQRARGSVREQFAVLLKDTARSGVTTLRICGLGAFLGADDIDLVRAATGNTPPLRVRGTLDLRSSSIWRDRVVLPGEGDDVLRFDVVAACFVECRDTDRDLREKLGVAARNGWPIILHVDNAEDFDASIDLLATLRPSGARVEGRNGIECRCAPSSAQFARLHDLGLSVGLSFAEAAADNSVSQGEARDDVSDSAMLSLGVDAIVGPSSPSVILSHAMNRSASRLSILVALRAITLGAARRCGVGEILGSMEVGKYADFAFLDADPRRVPANEIEKIRCVGTWLAGREIRI